MKKSAILIVSFFFILSSLTISAQTWSPLIRLTWNAGDSYDPSIATDSGNKIHVMWSDYTPGNYDIFYKRSTDGGVSWSGITRLTWNSGYSLVPSIVTDSGSVIHVVWEDDTYMTSDIFYKRSSDGGASWSGRKQLTWNQGWSSNPIIASDSSNGIHMVWFDAIPIPSNSEILYKHSSDSGASWSGPIRLTWNSGWSLNPSIATDSENGIHVVWYDDTFGNFEILYKRSTDGGASWSAIKRLTWNTGFSEEPSITTDSGNGIHVVWHDRTPGNYEIFYKRSTDGGVSWSGITRLTWNSGESGDPSAVANSGNEIHVVWRDASTYNDEIFHKYSSNSGVSWCAITRLTWNSGESCFPAITSSSADGIHVVWYDKTPGNREIFYKNRK